jgi:hypothetical protein
MTKAAQLSAIVASLALGILANIYLQGAEKSTTTALAYENKGSESLLSGDRSAQNNNTNNATTNEAKTKQAKIAFDTPNTGKKLEEGNQAQQYTESTERQASLEAELASLNRRYTKLNERYQSSKARLDILRTNATSMDSNLIGTSFEKLHKELSPADSNKYRAFKDKVDTVNSSYELQTILSDYFALQVSADVASLHAIECKEYECILHLYSNDSTETLEALRGIVGISSEYSLGVTKVRYTFIEKEAYPDETYGYVALLTIIAEKN